MATQFVNEASSTATIDGSEIEFTSNSVTAELLDDTSLTLVKTQSQDLVVSGSTITYTIVITNNATAALTDVDFSDTIPTGLTYTTDSFTVNGVSETPTVSGQDLTYTISSLSVGATVIIFSVTVD